MIVLWHTKKNCFERWVFVGWKIKKQECFMNINSGAITWGYV